MTTNQQNTTTNLWNQNVSPQTYGSAEQYYEHVMEQYKLYVEMADRTSARRNSANTFFLTLHTLIVSAVGFTYEKGPQTTTPWVNIFPLIVLLGLCYFWWQLIISYKRLNTAKYQVIGDFESRLPVCPYVKAEWELLGKGENSKNFTPLSNIEAWIPIAFAILYIIGALAISFL